MTDFFGTEIMNLSDDWERLAYTRRRYGQDPSSQLTEKLSEAQKRLRVSSTLFPLFWMFP
jgi:hypothetical protein